MGRGRGFSRHCLQAIARTGDILAQLTHYHVAAVEAKIEEALRRSLWRKLCSARQLFVSHNRTRRLLRMGVGMSQQDLAQGHAMPLIVRCRPAVAQYHSALIAGISFWAQRGSVIGSAMLELPSDWNTLCSFRAEP